MIYHHTHVQDYMTDTGVGVVAILAASPMSIHQRAQVYLRH